MKKTITRLAMLVAGGYLLYKWQYRLPGAKSGNSLLWELSGNGLKKPSYLLGTMHLMCAEDAVLGSNAVRVLQRVEKVYLEVDMNASGELLGGTVDFFMKDDACLAGLLEPGEYEEVKTFFARHQPFLPFDVLERQHPLVLASSLYELLLPCEQKNGMEVKIVQQALALHKQVGGLETLDFQGEIFNSIPCSQQAYDLLRTIQQIDRFSQSMHEMLDAYRRQDIELLYQLTLHDETGMATHLDLLLYNRNATWAERIGAIAPTQPSLFAVGAGHLGGARGVLSLLRQQGFRLRPILNSP